MPANYVLLEKITVGAAGASSVTFSGIPQTGYTDLVVKVSARMTAAATGEYIQMSFNGVTTNLNSRILYGYTTAASSYTEASIIPIGLLPGSTTTASTFGNVDVYIPNYTASVNKSVSVDAVSENNSGATNAAYQMMIAGLWSSTAAITSVTLTAKTGNLDANSTFYLYGVAKLGTTPAIVPYATGGDTIMTDGTYWYHTFISSGTFTPAKGLSADILCIGGGGGGASYCGGGGGAGGIIYFASNALSATGYTITVGAGGAAQTSGNGNNGNNAQFGSLTVGLGGGGGGTGGNGLSGGSGGGGSYQTTTGGASTQSSTGATAIYGNAGGNGNNGGAGGGGAGAVGSNSTTVYNPGAGGNGTTAFSSWGSVTGTGQNSSGTYYYAGGASGGGLNGFGSTTKAGGLGGGGVGTITGVATAGTANTGGGGGGGGEVAGSGGGATSVNGAAGGSGIVIVRYAV
jgi:hypothetical protein